MNTRRDEQAEAERRVRLINEQIADEQIIDEKFMR